MRHHSIVRNSSGQSAATLRHHLVLAALTLAVALTFLFLAHNLSSQQMLPAISLAALCGAGVIAAFAYLFREQQRAGSISAWDVSGAFALFGFAAATLSEPDQILALFGYSSALAQLN